MLYAALAKWGRGLWGDEYFTIKPESPYGITEIYSNLHISLYTISRHTCSSIREANQSFYRVLVE